MSAWSQDGDFLLPRRVQMGGEGCAVEEVATLAKNNARRTFSSAGVEHDEARVAGVGMQSWRQTIELHAAGQAARRRLTRHMTSLVRAGGEAILRSRS